MLSDYDKKTILKQFPKIELCYDKVLHNKVYNNDNDEHCYAYILIPKGMKVYVWFTYFEDKNVCLVLSYDKEKKILNSDDISLVHIPIFFGTPLYCEIKFTFHVL